MLEFVEEYLKANDVQYIRNKKIKDYSPIKIGGNARIVVLPKNKAEFANVLSDFKKQNVEFTVLGNLSNVLPCDGEYDKVIIKTDKMTKSEFSGRFVNCECGVRLPFICGELMRRGLSGIEELSGIPAQLGGAVYGNAGAFGREISDVITDCELYDLNSRDIEKISVSELGFKYRESLFSKKDILLLSVNMRFSLSEPDLIKKRMLECKAIRESTQPIGIPSLGSVFRKPSQEVSAAKLIDLCGFKGYSVGGAAVSEKHAGFIVNRGGATAEDFKRLMNIIRAAVLKKFGITLQSEIEFL